MLDFVFWKGGYGILSSLVIIHQTTYYLSLPPCPFNPCTNSGYRCRVLVEKPPILHRIYLRTINTRDQESISPIRPLISVTAHRYTRDPVTVIMMRLDDVDILQLRRDFSRLSFPLLFLFVHLFWPLAEPCVPIFFYPVCFEMFHYLLGAIKSQVM